MSVGEGYFDCSFSQQIEKIDTSIKGLPLKVLASYHWLIASNGTEFWV